jgi:molybdopterin synthase sulfur carrier subunit
MFAAARVAAGRAEEDFGTAEAPTIAALLDHACARYGDDFAAVLATSRVWLNGDEPESGLTSPLAEGDEVAILPPVSGGT